MAFDSLHGIPLVVPMAILARVKLTPWVCWTYIEVGKKKTHIVVTPAYPNHAATLTPIKQQKCCGKTAQTTYSYLKIILFDNGT